MQNTEKRIKCGEGLMEFLGENVLYEFSENSVVISEGINKYKYSIDDCIEFFESLISISNLNGETELHYTPECNHTDKNDGIPLSEFCPKLRLFIDKSIPSIV
ncbi:hypothetical protein [Helicobacter rodentium]|uniref:hypothetical protein n=1 Tax=Helicobacter rodentium TaxID=59617 RepID=UPI0025A5D6DE|nr:hypothetical protein [Helicobacter rodentium]